MVSVRHVWDAWVQEESWGPRYLGPREELGTLGPSVLNWKAVRCLGPGWLLKQVWGVLESGIPQAGEGTNGPRPLSSRGELVP